MIAKTTKTGPTPAVTYIRMSSGKQEVSPEQQRGEVARLARKHNCRILREYYDAGISGDATDKRLDFQRMIADAEEKGDFAAILCWDQDRFGRFDSIEAGRWIYPLRKAGVWLITCAQGRIDWNDFAGRVTYNVVQEGKHEFLQSLSRNVCRGRLAAMEAGTAPLPPVYGYDRLIYDPNGTLTRRVPSGEKFSRPKAWTVRLDPATDGSADTVRWIHTTFSEEDCGILWLVGELNRKGIPSPRGRRTWNWGAVYYILTNPIYVGMRAEGRFTGGKYHAIGDNREIAKGSGTRQTHKRLEPLFLRQGNHTPLVEADIFERNQRKLAMRRQNKTRPRKSPYLLAGLLFCGHCGGRLYGGPGGAKTADGYSLRYYACETGTKQGKSRCRKYAVRKDHLEKYILDIVTAAVSSTEAEGQIRDAIWRQAKAQTRSSGNTPALKAQIRALEAKIEKAAENVLLADGAVVPELTKVLDQWRKQRATLAAQLEAKSNSGGNPDRLADKALAELARLRYHLEAGEPAKVRQVVKSVISKVTLWWEPKGKRRRVLRGLVEFNSSGVSCTTARGSVRTPVTFSWRQLSETLKYFEVAATVRTQYQGTPVRTVAIARILQARYANVNGFLRLAARAGLVQHVRYQGWTPIESPKVVVK